MLVKYLLVELTEAAVEIGLTPSDEDTGIATSLSAALSARTENRTCKAGTKTDDQSIVRSVNMNLLRMKPCESVLKTLTKKAELTRKGSVTGQLERRHACGIHRGKGN